jgi:hypothetical protein
MGLSHNNTNCTNLDRQFDIPSYPIRDEHNQPPHGVPTTAFSPKSDPSVSNDDGRGRERVNDDASNDIMAFRCLCS